MLIDTQKDEIEQIFSVVKAPTGPKPPKLEIYKGRRDALEIYPWMDQIKRFAEHYKLSTGDTANLAIFYLFGSARDWWTNQPTDTKKALFASWEAELKITFYPTDHERKIMDTLERLTQR